MELGAIVVVPENPYCKLGGTGWSGEVSHPLPLWPVAGKNLVQDWSEKVRRIGASLVAVTPGGETPAANRKFQAAWNLAKQGVERLLVISLKSYAEIDLIDFVKFHQERRNSATEACDTEGPLGVELINAASLCFQDGVGARSGVSDDNRAAQYRFDGYAKRLQSVKLYRDLVSDALRGRCALTPSGLQTDEGVWIGHQTQIAPSVRLVGPCFVGDGTLLRDFVSIGPYATVENHCCIESGTRISGSSVMPNTFLAAGLDIRRSVVDGPRLEHLDSGTLVDLHASALGGRIPPKAKAAHPDMANPIPSWSTPAASDPDKAARLADV